MHICMHVYCIVCSMYTCMNVCIYVHITDACMYLRVTVLPSNVVMIHGKVSGYQMLDSSPAVCSPQGGGGKDLGGPISLLLLTNWNIVQNGIVYTDGRFRKRANKVQGVSSLELHFSWKLIVALGVGVLCSAYFKNNVGIFLKRQERRCLST